MPKLKLALLVLFAVSVMSSCSIYRMDIRQGNLIEQKDVDRIKAGMNQAQIRFLLGRPLVNDTFDNNVWYYINTFKSGKTQEVVRQELIVTFVDGKVTDLSGDFDIPPLFNSVSAQ